MKADKRPSSIWLYPNTRKKLMQRKLDLDIATHDQIINYLLEHEKR